MNRQLHSYLIGDNLTLQEAASSSAAASFLQGDDSRALLYSPQQCCFARFRAGRFTGPGDRPVETGSCFEARLFGLEAELRWLHTSEGRGRAVLLAESLADGTALKPESTSILGELKRRYLLWGEAMGENRSDGWTCLAERRIGELLAPVSGLQRGERVHLVTREYMSEADSHGNTSIFAERLVGLERLENRRQDRE